MSLPEIPEFLAVLNSHLDLDDLLPASLDLSLSLTGAERAFLMLHDSENNLSIQCARNSRHRNLGAEEFSGSTSIVRRTLEKEDALFIPRVQQDQELSSAKSIMQYGIESALCIPLRRFRKEKSPKAFLGLLYLDSSSKVAPLKEEHLQLMKALANHLSISIENASLFTEVQKQKEQIQNLNVKLQQKVEKQAGNLTEMRNLLAETQRELVQVYGLGNIVGKSQRMLRVFKLLEKVCPTSATVLVLGESGTGKELIARYVHYNGKRSEQPLVSVNCSAFNDTLLESELFGHRKGAFTGAVENKTGVFELADGGTLFLDEVGDMSLEMQKKVLRVLEDGLVRPVGAKETVKVDVRIVAATNRNLKELVQTGQFREDLYYRLNVLTIEVPPLRDRREDIPLLIDFFMNRIADELKQPVKPIPDSAMKMFLEYDWPGNVRELQNELRRVMILESEYNHEQLQSAGIENNEDGIRMDDVEKRAILRALEQANGNKSKAAELLGIPRSSFYVKLARYKIF
jgi:Nif-specific regulatory protein